MLLNEPKDQQGDLAQIKGLQQFRLAISEHERQMLLEEDQARKKASLKPLTLQGASAFLEEYYNQRRVYNLVTKKELSQDHDFNNIQSQKKSVCPHDKGDFPPTVAQTSNFLYNSNRPQYQQQHQDKRCKDIQKRPFQQRGTAQNDFVHPHSLGFHNHECLLCGKPGHKFQECRTYPPPQKIFKSLCHHCGLGAHANKLSHQISSAPHNNMGKPAQNFKQGQKSFPKQKN